VREDTTQARHGWGTARNRRGGPGYTPTASTSRSWPASPLSLLCRPRRCLPRPCSEPGAPRLYRICRTCADLTMTQCAVAGHIRLAAARRAVYVQVRSSPGVCTLSLTAISVTIFFSIIASYPSSPPLSHARDSPSPSSAPALHNRSAPPISARSTWRHAPLRAASSSRRSRPRRCSR
jgi:hypothetical protein